MGDEVIYLITGVPGSGKSLYAVSKLLRDFLKEKMKTDEGELTRRLCVDGIPNLILPHELLAPPKKVPNSNEFLPGEGDGLWNWHTWCKPGDVIVVDEVQRHWRPRGMGTKPPPEIAMLETHRHLGVDFVVITQNPMLIDQNVRRLVGRHQHVRRIFGGARALIYEWDGCQTDTSRLGTGTRTLFSYPKDAYKLYKSSELHTKQKHKIPIFFAFPLVVAGLAVFAGPSAYSALSGAMTGKGLVKSVQPALAASAPVQSTKSAGAASGFAAAPGASSVTTVVTVAKPKLSGCIASKTKCSCYGLEGERVEVERKVCDDEIGTVNRVLIVPAENKSTRNFSQAQTHSGNEVSNADQGPYVHPAGSERGNLPPPQQVKSVLSKD